ncbi:MAG: hypothetical protein DWQ01_05900 [Planctomycetota bacterium]|nr:MAG: hypothetical protein DWQ01_05900 [Planctomycetota bacterium]
MPPASPQPWTLPLPVFFRQPGDLPFPDRLPRPVAVLDLAFNGGDPSRDLAWIEQMGSDLAVWIDHHEQALWQRFQQDRRFVLVPRSEAPALPPLVTAERVQSFGPVGCLIAHGDTDGVLAAAKWMVLQQGDSPPTWLDPDSIVADTRKGEMTARGWRLDAALRTAGGKDRIRRMAIASVLAEAQGLPESYEVNRGLNLAVEDFQRILKTTEAIVAQAQPIPDLDRDAVWVDLRQLSPYLRLDATELMLRLQARHELVIVFGRARGGALKIIASTESDRTGLDLRQFFDLQGFAPFRVHLNQEQLLSHLPSLWLRQRLETP